MAAGSEEFWSETLMAATTYSIGPLFTRYLGAAGWIGPCALGMIVIFVDHGPMTPLTHFLNANVTPPLGLAACTLLLLLSIVVNPPVPNRERSPQSPVSCLPMVDLPSCAIGIEANVDRQEVWLQQHPTWLLAGLRAGTLRDHFVSKGTTEPTDLPITLENLGSITLPTGRLVACDPYIGAGAPFTVPLPIGNSTVAVARALVGEDHRRITAAALIAQPDQTIVRWTCGQTSDGDLSGKLGEFWAYGVDAGTGCFAPAEVLETLGEVMDADAGMLEDPISRMLFDGPGSSTEQAGIVAPREGALPIAAFSSGWGDGSYGTWLGHAADDSVVLALTDFQIATDPWTMR